MQHKPPIFNKALPNILCIGPKKTGYNLSMLLLCTAINFTLRDVTMTHLTAEGALFD